MGGRARPTFIIQQLNFHLPEEYGAEARVHVGSFFEVADPSEYEVLICEADGARRLVAAIELVSPANQDRSEHRKAFVSKCAAFLHQRVSVSIVDIVTIRRSNLHAEFMQDLERFAMGLHTVVTRSTGILPVRSSLA